MRNPEFVTGLQNAIARRDQAEAQRVMKAYALDKKGDYNQFNSHMINQIAYSINAYAYYLQNPPSTSTCSSGFKNCCSVITCCAATTCLFNGSYIVALFTGITSFYLFKEANEEVREQANNISKAKSATLENSAEALFKFCDDYCRSYPLSNLQNPQSLSTYPYPFIPSAPSI